MKTFDVVIIGASIEGMTAAVYCSRKGLKTLILDPVETIEYSSYGGLDDLKLIHRLKQQAGQYGTEFLTCTVHSIWCKHTPKIIYANDGSICCYGLILAMGTSPQKLGIPMESQLHGCGLNYHDSCTSSYLKGRTVAVFGKNEKAVAHSIALSALCKEVYLIHPNGILDCPSDKVEVLKNSPNVVLLPHTLIYNVERKNKKITGINIIDKTTGNLSCLDCEIIYVSKDDKANSKLCFPYILTDNKGFIITDKNHKTNIDGIYAAGGIRSTILDENPGSCCTKNANMAATDGAIAAINVIKYIESL